MGLMDKILDKMKLDPDDEYEYGNEDYEDDYEDVKSSKTTKKQDSFDDFELEDRKKTKTSKQSSSKITPIRNSRRGQSQSSGMEVCVIRPAGFEDAREITETLLLGRPVVLNMEGLDLELAQRIIDFASGSCFAISGNLQKISNYIFIITPESVDISGDFQNLVDSFDLNTFQSEF